MHILATLCYVKDEKYTLMLYRNKKENDVHEGKWNGLGGKIEKGESPEECVIREVLEESGLRIKNPWMHGFITFPDFDGFNDWCVFIFTAKEFEGNLIDSTEGKLEWIQDEDVKKLNLWDGDKIFLDWLKEDKFFSAKFNYSAGELIDYKVNFF